jgi:DNA repair exonuclease SbcCD nuclease subunit
MKIKLLQCGDLHLDAPFTSLADSDSLGIDDKPEQRRNDLRLVLSRIVETAAAQQVDLLLICGDLYEHNYIRKSTIHYISDLFKGIPHIPILMIPGNHDPFVPGSYYSDYEWPSNVHILNDGVNYYEHRDGTRVYGLLPTNEILDKSVINILMHHGTVDMPFSADAFAPVSSAELEALGFDYYALGHFHTQIHGAGSARRIYNAGSPEPLGFDEEGDHGVIITTIEKDLDGHSSIQANFLSLCSRRFINLDVTVTGCPNSEQAAIRIASAMEQAGSSDDLYRIMISGYISQVSRFDMDLLADFLKERAFYIKLIDNTAPEYDFERIAEEPGLRGLFVRKMLDRAMEASDTEEKALIMQALYYGMEAIDEGKVCI